MEAVPRMPMLAFELKTSSEPVEFTPILKYYISEIYHEDPEAYTKECNEFDQLRQTAIQVSKDFVGCSVLKKYYCQLQFLHSRFPLLAQRPDDGSSDLIFTWDDVYMGRPISHSQTTYEQACILYNIGALHSILGALDNRQTPEGMKVSCTHFQCAAWAFEHLRDHFGSVLSPDMSRDMLTFQAQLMLAQAQECILEKSMADNRKSTITAKVAEQIVEYYQMALKALSLANASNILGSRQLKEWKRRLEMMSHYHRSVKFLYLGSQSEEQQKWGERLAYLQEAHARLTECIKMAKNDDDDIQEALRFTMDVVGGKYNSAKKDNDFIYHEKVPDLASLPDVKGASLVKGIPFNTDDPEVSGQDIFRKLVPIEAHEASSLYSEEKAKLLRRVGATIEMKDSELSQFLTSIQVDVAHLHPQTGVDVLPDVLMSKCAAISVRSEAVTDLVKCMRSLANVVTDVEGSIREIGVLLEEEQKQEAEFQAQFGKRAFNVTLGEIKKESDKYEEAMKKGAESNAELHKAMNTHISHLKMLCLPPEELAKALPSVSPSGTAENDLTFKEMERLFAKIDEMKAQRHMFGEQFREQVHTDDITSALVTREEVNQEEFFSEQLKKHDKLVGLIEQNLTAQDNILQTVTETNAKYAPVKKQLADAMRKREEMIQSLVLSFDVYEDLLGKCHKGVDFYDRLQANASKLLERTERVCRMQYEERQQIITRHQPKAAAPARPVADKPGVLASGLPIGMPVGQPNAQPKLKDYLPFMKPASFGPGVAGSLGGGKAYGGVSPTLGNIPQLPSHIGSASAPGSQSASPMHLPQLASSQPTSPAHASIPASKPLSAAHGYTPGGSTVSQVGVPLTLQAATGVPSQLPATATGANYSGATPQMYYSTLPHNQTQLHDKSMPVSPVPAMQQYQMPRSTTSGTAASVTGGGRDAALPQLSSHSHAYATTPQSGVQSGLSSTYQPQPVTANVVPQCHLPGHGSPYAAMPVHSQNLAQQHRQVAPQPTPCSGNFPHRLPSLPPGGAQYVPGYPPSQAGVVGVNYANQPQSYLPRGSGPSGAGQPVQQPGALPLQGQPGMQPYPHLTGQPTYTVPGQQVGYRPQATPGSVQSRPGQQQAYQPQGVPPQTAGSSQEQQTCYQGTPHTLAGPQAAYQPHPQGTNMTAAGQLQLPSSNSNSNANVQAACQPQLPSSNANMPAAYQSQLPSSNVNMQTAYQPQVPDSSANFQATYRTQSHSSNANSNANVQAAYQSQIPSSSASMQAAYQSQIPSSNANMQAAYQSQLPSSSASMQGAYPSQIPSSNANMQAAYQSQVPYSNANMQATYRTQSHSSNANGSASVQATYQPQLPGSNVNMQAAYQSQLQSSIANTTTAYQSYNNSLQTVDQPQSVSSSPYMLATSQAPGNNTDLQTAYQQPHTQSSSANTHTAYQPQLQNNNTNMQAVYQPQPQSSNINPQTAYQPQPQSNNANMQAAYRPQSHSNNANMQAANQLQSQNSNVNMQAAYQPQSQNSNVNMHAAYQPQSQSSNVNMQAAYRPQSQSSNVNMQAAYQPPTQSTNNANMQTVYRPQLQNNAANPQAIHQQNTTFRPQLQQQWQQPQQTPLQQQLPQLLPSQQQQQPPPLPAPLQPTLTAQATLTASKPPERASSLPPNNPTSRPASHSRQNSNVSNSSSLDDILSTSPDSTTRCDGVLRPRVVTAEDVRRLREEEEKNQLKIDAQKDPYVDPAVLDRFVDQVSKFEKLVDGLMKHTLNGPTPLDKEWKDLNDEQDQFSRKCSMAIARCYPLKNHQPNIMPYDASRVLLTGGKDDYINASHIGDLVASCPKVIATQHPLMATVVDFWQMVYEQGTEVVVMLCHANELNKRLHPYWPEVKGQSVTFGPFSISLQSVQTKQAWTERILSLTNNKTHKTRPVVHLQFTHWPPSGEPESPSLLLQFISQVHYFYIQQRNLVKPLVVHCSNGVGRTGTFCVIYTGVQEINRGHGIVDIADLVQRLRQRRKYMVEEQSQLAFSYRAILYFAQDLLMKRGILTSRASFGDKLPARGERVHQRTPSEDFIMGTGSSLGMIQSNVAKMSFRATSVPNAATTNSHTSGPPTQESSSSNSDNAMSVDVGLTPTTAVNNKVSGQVETEKGDSVFESVGMSPACDESLASKIPESLAKLQDPHTFQLGSSTPPSETRITKASFTSKTSGLTDNVSKSDDPLSALDPLWTLKGQSQSS